MKEKYEKPSIELYEFETQYDLTTSSDIHLRGALKLLPTPNFWKLFSKRKAPKQIRFVNRLYGVSCSLSVVVTVVGSVRYEQASRKSCFMR